MKKIASAIFIALFSSITFAAQDAAAISSRNCNPVVPETIKYRPRYASCNGNAAVLLSGKYYNAFSVVLKKVDHGDRLGNACPDANCSPFKTQKIIKDGKTRVNCFGASGFSKVFNGHDPFQGYSTSFVAKWISIKTRNTGKLKDVEIYCLKKPYPRTSVN